MYEENRRFLEEKSFSVHPPFKKIHLTVFIPISNSINSILELLDYVNFNWLTLDPEQEPNPPLDYSLGTLGT